MGGGRAHLTRDCPRAGRADFRQSFRWSVIRGLWRRSEHVFPPATAHGVVLVAVSHEFHAKGTPRSTYHRPWERLVESGRNGGPVGATRSEAATPTERTRGQSPRRIVGSRRGRGDPHESNSGNAS